MPARAFTTGGPANVTLDSIAYPRSGIGTLTVYCDGTANGGSVVMQTGGNAITIAFTHTANATSIGVANQDSPGGDPIDAIIDFSGVVLTDAIITLSDITTLPDIPSGCSAITITGVTSSTTLTSGTVIPATINISAVTGGTLTTIDFSAATSNSGGGAVSHLLSGQAFGQTSVNSYFAQMVTALSDVTSGTIDLSGGTNAAPSPVIVSGAGTAAANGTYTARGSANGRVYFNLVGQPSDATTNSLAWSAIDLAWEIFNSEGINLYYSDNVAYPWFGVWITNTDNAVDPPPSVTGGNAAVATLIAQGITLVTN